MEDYDELKAEIASYIARSDVTSSSDVITTFITLAEKMINRKLRTRKMEMDADLSTVSSENTIDLPTDFLEIRSLEFDSAPKTIDFESLDSFKRLYAGQDIGRPKIYTLTNNSGDTLSSIRLAPVPDGVYDLSLVYFSKIPPLSEAVTTNWLLDYYPEIYLNGALYYAFKRYRSPLAADYKALFDADIQTLNDEDDKSFTGGAGMRTRITGTVV